MYGFVSSLALSSGALASGHVRHTQVYRDACHGLDTTGMSDHVDSLGLDKPIKLGRVLKVPKLTDELLLENNRGLPQITQNYRKLSKALKKNDKRYAEKSRSLSKSTSHQLKVSTEAENLKKVLSFYQLWCHGLFPRANFQDCLRIIRNHKSPGIREYRRALLDAEIRRLKIEKGIIVEREESENDSDTENQPPVSTGNATVQDNGLNDSVPEASDEDDWGFLSVNRRSTNGLFIGDDDDDENATPRAPEAPTTTGEDIDLDDFDENDFLPNTTQKSVSDDEHQAELDIMNEMGM